MIDNIANNRGTTLSISPTRCVIVVDQNLPIGRAANATAVIALTIGQRHPILVGEPLVDKSGFNHPGLIPMGITVLAASSEELLAIRQKGVESECDVVDFPMEGQQTTNYQTFREAVAVIEPQSLRYVGVALVGQKKKINRIIGHLGLLK